MGSSPSHPRPTAGKLLSPASLCRDFGARATVTRDAVKTLHDAIVSTQQSALAHWKTFFGKWARRSLDKTRRELAKLAPRYGIAAEAAAREAPLLALQTYYALLVTLSPGGLDAAGSTTSCPRVHTPGTHRRDRSRSIDWLRG